MGVTRRGGGFRRRFRGVVIVLLLCAGLRSPLDAQQTYEPADIRAARMIVQGFEQDEDRRRAETRRRRAAAQRARRRAYQNRASSRDPDGASRGELAPATETTDYLGARRAQEAARAAQGAGLGAAGGGALHLIGVAPRNKRITASSPDYDLRADESTGSGGDRLRAYLYSRSFETATVDTFEASHRSSDWAVAGLVLNPIQEEETEGPRARRSPRDSATPTDSAAPLDRRDLWRRHHHRVARHLPQHDDRR